MLKNYIKVAVRQLLRQKFYSSINIIGLAVGMAVCLLVFFYVKHEMTYDQWYSDSDRLYRVNGAFIEDGVEEIINVSPFPLADLLNEAVPEVEAATRLHVEWWSDYLLEANGKHQYSKSTARIDKHFFKIFDVPFLYGDAKSALDRPEKVVVSKGLAEYFFGKNVNPIGKEIKYNGDRTFIVGGVMDDLPGPSHFDFDFYRLQPKQSYENWEWVSMFNYYTYAKVKPNVSIAQFEENINRSMRNDLVRILQADGVTDLNSESAQDFLGIGMHVQSVKDIHLKSTFDREILPKGNSTMIYGFIMVAFILILIATINFMNLSTARSASRARVIGVRKVVGATRYTSTRQFLIEALLQTFIAFGIALIIAQLFLPTFNQLLRQEIQLFPDQLALIILLGIPFVILIGLMAGSYPALFLSRFMPIQVLQGDYSASKKGSTLRQILVIGQFVGCGIILMFLFNVFRQVQYMSQKELGFVPEQVLVVPIQKDETKEKFQVLRNTLLDYQGIEAVSLVEHLPGDEMGGNYYTCNGMNKLLDFNQVDAHFDEALGLELIAGTFFQDRHLQDTLPQYIVNKSFLDVFGIQEDPIGLPLSKGGEQIGQIIGVVKDFHWKGFTESIQPFVLEEYSAYLAKVAIRFKAEDLSGTIDQIEETWKRVEPEYPVQFTFLDEDFAALYQRHIDFGNTLSYLALLVVFTALLGLFGLSTFMAEQRKKEIGIRKVLGATLEQLSFMMINEFSKLILIALVIALPLGYWLSNIWLQDFAYRVDISIWVLVLASLVLLGIAIITVLSQAIRAAVANPVDSLRNE